MKNFNEYKVKVSVTIAPELANEIEAMRGEATRSRIYEKVIRAGVEALKVQA